MSHLTKNCGLPKKQLNPPLLQLKMYQSLPLPLTRPPPPLLPHPQCPLALHQNPLPAPRHAPGCPPIIPPVLLQLSTTREQRVGTMASPTSASHSWCHPMLSATPLAYFSPRTSSPMGPALRLISLSSVGLRWPQHHTPLRVLAQCQHHSSYLQTMAARHIHKVSWYTLTFILALIMAVDWNVYCPATIDKRGE